MSELRGVGLGRRAVWPKGLEALVLAALAAVALVLVLRERAVLLGFVSPGFVAWGLGQQVLLQRGLLRPMKGRRIFSRPLWVIRPMGLPRMPLRLGRILRG